MQMRDIDDPPSTLRAISETRLHVFLTCDRCKRIRHLTPSAVALLAEILGEAVTLDDLKRRGKCARCALGRVGQVQVKTEPGG